MGTLIHQPRVTHSLRRAPFPEQRNSDCDDQPGSESVVCIPAVSSARQQQPPKQRGEYQ